VLREAWSCQHAPPQLPFSAKARLGSVIHGFLEDAGRGKLAGNSEESLASQWRMRLSAVEASMSESWVERHLIPLSRHVNDFEVRRIRAWSKAAAIAEEREEAIGGAGAGHAAAFERWVQTEDGHVGGFIDRLIYSPSGTVIVDYKSGPILESYDEQDERASINKAYRDQLRLYAALVNEADGAWPIRLDLVPLTGPTFSVPFSPEECSALLSKAQGLYTALNRTLSRTAERAGAGYQASLATPTAAACTGCAYRPICSAYRDSNCQSFALPKRLWDVWGKLRRITTASNGRVSVELVDTNHTEQSNVHIANLSASRDRHPALASATVGKQLAFFNVTSTRGTGSFIESSLTTIFHDGD